MTQQARNTYQDLHAEVTAAAARLVAVSKQRPVVKIEELYALGQRDFGENRVPELLEKASALPDDVRWHFIGHLQRNKVKPILPFVDLIHSGDSARLLRTINRHARELDRPIRVLLQFHVAREASKYGLDPHRPFAVLDELSEEDRTHLRLAGVMGMATYTDDEERVGKEFDLLREVFDQLRASGRVDAEEFRELSMGMSGDYRLALARGATLVRVGSLLFR